MTIIKAVRPPANEFIDKHKYPKMTVESVALPSARELRRARMCVRKRATVHTRETKVAMSRPKNHMLE
jgi:hypothetical protein